MPFYFYRPRWRRNRWFRPWRTRRAFRRRRRRRKAYYRGVRKRKAKQITLKQWQPITIKKTIIRGFYPAFLTNKHRITNNMTKYIDTIAPTHFDGGGGFAISQFTLNGLYELFIKAQNWWTQSNCWLPLIRYFGCQLTFYRSENYDYVAHVHRCLPLKATDDLYMASQPYIMLMSKKCIKIHCKQNSKSKKPFKKVFVKPPTQYTNKWMFQADMCNQPLLIVQTAACSFDRMYLAADWQSTTVGFISLNTQSFVMHNWNNPPTTGYHPQTTQYLYGTQNGASQPMKEKVTNLIYLGTTKSMSTGVPITNTQGLNQLATKETMWGNIFIPHYFSQEGAVFVSQKSPHDLQQHYSGAGASKLTTDTIETSTIFTPKSTPNYIYCRYNPLADKGTGNKIYIVSNTLDQTPWQPPTSAKLIRENLPLWVIGFGYLDWQKTLNETIKIDTDKILVIQSPYITPKQTYYVPLDQSFIDGRSPHKENDITDYDEQHWYPKVAFQMESINSIVSSGPGTIKLPKESSAEGHYSYKFIFKLGGCPPPMDKICNPVNQPVYPVPNNEQPSTSLQSPRTAIQTYLYNFDERRGEITTKAAKRIKKDYETEKTMLPFAGQSSMDVRASPETSPAQTPEDSEEEEESIHLQLRQLRRKQKLLRKRILQLLDTQNLE
nr:MAG: ORF1 [TTV-like mini virus]